MRSMFSNLNATRSVGLASSLRLSMAVISARTSPTPVAGSVLSTILALVMDPTNSVGSLLLPSRRIPEHVMVMYRPLASKAR